MTIDPLRALAEQARSAIGADRCTIFAVDTEHGEVCSRIALGLPEGQQIRLPLSRGVIGFVARTGRTLRLRDAYNDPRFDPSVDRYTGYRTRSVLCVPVIDAGGEVLGAIEAINKLGEGSFSPDDERRLAELSARAAPLLTPPRTTEP